MNLKCLCTCTTLFCSSRYLFKEIFFKIVLISGIFSSPEHSQIELLSPLSDLLLHTHSGRGKTCSDRLILVLEQDFPDIAMSTSGEECKNPTLARGQAFIGRSKLAEGNVDFRYRNISPRFESF
uniref:Uncharacterized protein n=1 Tax=Salix viminalis TaxID=40686 RepID=A0A6N2N2X9_SALVM